MVVHSFTEQNPGNHFLISRIFCRILYCGNEYPYKVNRRKRKLFFLAHYLQL